MPVNNKRLSFANFPIPFDHPYTLPTLIVAVTASSLVYYYLQSSHKADLIEAVRLRDIKKRRHLKRADQRYASLKVLEEQTRVYLHWVYHERLMVILGRRKVCQPLWWMAWSTVVGNSTLLAITLQRQWCTQVSQGKRRRWLVDEKMLTQTQGTRWNNARGQTILWYHVSFSKDDRVLGECESSKRQ